PSPNGGGGDRAAPPPPRGTAPTKAAPPPAEERRPPCPLPPSCRPLRKRERTVAAVPVPTALVSARALLCGPTHPQGRRACGSLRAGCLPTRPVGPQPGLPAKSTRNERAGLRLVPVGLRAGSPDGFMGGQGVQPLGHGPGRRAGGGIQIGLERVQAAPTTSRPMPCSARLHRTPARKRRVPLASPRERTRLRAPARHPRRGRRAHPRRRRAPAAGAPRL